METKFNFKSQICTDKIQSEHLLALGLKKETADMVHFFSQSLAQDWTIVPLSDGETARYIQGLEIPAWSLGRLLEMLPSPIPISEYLPTFHHYAYLDLSKVSAHYYWEDYDGPTRALASFCGDGLFAAVVDATEWLIEEGNFPKEYLEE